MMIINENRFRIAGNERNILATGVAAWQAGAGATVEWPLSSAQGTAGGPDGPGAGPKTTGRGVAAAAGSGTGGVKGDGNIAAAGEWDAGDGTVAMKHLQNLAAQLPHEAWQASFVFEEGVGRE